MTRYPLVVITWRDHCSNDEWLRLEQIEGRLNTDAAIVTAGYLTSQDDQKYIIVQNVSTGDDELMSMAMGILKADVITYKEIPEGELKIGD